jgi:hypothetical protein
MVFEDDKISCPIPDAPSTCLLIANEGETRADRVKCKISLTTPLVEARSFCFDSYTADSCLSRLKGLRCASDGILRLIHVRKYFRPGEIQVEFNITDVSFFGKLWRCLCLSTPSYYPVRYSAIRGAITRQLDEEGNCYSGDILVSLWDSVHLTPMSCPSTTTQFSAMSVETLNLILPKPGCNRNLTESISHGVPLSRHNFAIKRTSRSFKLRVR